MEPLQTATLTAVVAVGGRWAKGKPLSLMDASAAVVVALGLTVLESIDQGTAEMFSWLILLGVALSPFTGNEDANITAIMKKTGLIGKAK